jgi:ADP-ribose pyrophosphatase
MSAGFRAEGEEEVYRGHIITVARGRFRAPDGSPFTRDVVHHPGAVAVVPLLDEDTVVLVRQYRAPVDAEILELPAGLRDVDGEASIDTARRELTEETGYRAGRIEPLTRYLNSAGFCDEQMEIFLATDLTVAAVSLQGVEEQHMTVERLALDEAMSLIDKGELRDAKTVVGILMTLRRLGR